jgi:hypothetical protein
MATIITNFYTVDNQIGANLNQPQTISVTTNPEIPGPNSVLGDICQGIGGSQWVFVKASTTVTALNVVKIDESFNANNCDWSTANGVSNMKTLGLAEFQASVANAGDYFWAMVAGRGGALVNVLSTAAAQATLYISSSAPGVVTTTVNSTATNAVLTNAALPTALASTTAALEIVFAYMRGTTQ